MLKFFILFLQSDSVQMVQSGVNSVPSGMIVGRPGNQQQTPGQSLGNPPSKKIHFNLFIIFYN